MKTVKNPDYIQLLLAKGGILKVYETFPSRSKYSGRMWDGRARVEYSGVVYHFKLWHHGTDEETEDSLRPHFNIDGIEFKKYYDFSWHGMLATDGIYLHTGGWFRDRKLAEHPFIESLPNSNLYSVELTDGEKAVVAALGFKRIFAV